MTTPLDQPVSNYVFAVTSATTALAVAEQALANLYSEAGITEQVARLEADVAAAKKQLAVIEKDSRAAMYEVANAYYQEHGSKPASPLGVRISELTSYHVPDFQSAVWRVMDYARFDLLALDVKSYGKAFPAFVNPVKTLIVAIDSKLIKGV